jgi:hypothetical protein
LAILQKKETAGKRIGGFLTFTPIRANGQQWNEKITIGPNGMKKKDWMNKNKKIILIYSFISFLYFGCARARNFRGDECYGGIKQLFPSGSKKLLWDYKTYPNSPISVHSPRSALG